MGTRNSTIVKSKGKTKVAQYGQWDGYPTGQGKTIADFLKTVDLPKFKKQIDALGEYTDKDLDRIEKEWDKMADNYVKHPDYEALTRDNGAGILQLIHNGTVKKVRLDENFKNDKTFCEYWYELNLDDETIIMNGGKKYTFKEWTRKGLMEKLEKAESEE